MLLMAMLHEKEIKKASKIFLLCYQDEKPLKFESKEETRIDISHKKIQKQKNPL